MPENSPEGLQGDMSFSDGQDGSIQVAREWCRNGDLRGEQRQDAHSVRNRGGGDEEILPNV